MDSSAEQQEYDTFLEQVKKTIYVDNLSPLITEKVVEAAFGQFGTVKSVQFIANYLEPENTARAALVEMGSAKQASNVVSETRKFCFMVSGMPRPVRTRAAEPEMFENHPRKPGRRIFCRWIDPEEPDFEVAMKIKKLVVQQDAEASFLRDVLLAEEEKLHTQQSETLKNHHKKFEIIDKVFDDGTAKQLGNHYNVQLSDA